MGLTKEQKTEIVKQFGSNEKNTGDTSVQIAILTNEITQLTKHMIANKKDNHSKLGLQKKVSKRRSLMVYLRRTNFEKYEEVRNTLNLKDVK